jgi:tRNA(Ile)-lysidine synthase
MRTKFEQRILESIRREGTILPGSRVGVAVSGGADSVALLRLLVRLTGEMGITLMVAHLNHSLRGSESGDDAVFVEKLAAEHGLRFVQRVEDVAAAAEIEGWNLEDAGRRLRRRFFEQLVAEGSADQIAVAHTADDQAETLLGHLMRGTGTTGLGGIYPVAGPVVRPLLGTRRQDLREYLVSLNQDWREDSTNNDTGRLRARIRKDLLPLIERDFSTGIVGHLNDLARLAREEEQFWAEFIEEQFSELVRKTETDMRIAVNDLLAPLKMHGATSVKNRTYANGPAAPVRTVTERLIRRLYEVARGDRRELTAKHVEKVIHLASDSKSGSCVELPGAVTARLEFGDVVFTRKDRGDANETAGGDDAYQYLVDLPLVGNTTVSVAKLGKRLSLNLIDWPNVQRDTIRDQHALDADLLRSPLILRNWRPGDSYRPRGRRNGRKLKELLLAERVPASQRGAWPVLESGGQVIWALGMAPADQCGVGAETRKGLLIVEEKG